MELRQHKRYRLVATVNLEWVTADGFLHKATGQTRDISAAGVFILSPELLPSGISVDLVVNLPSLQDENSGAQLKTRGHVLRIDANGFAVIADTGFRMKFSEGQFATPSYSKSRREETVTLAGTGWRFR